MKCKNCGQKINVPETALELCDICFNEKCKCGHKRAIHVDNNGSCVHEYSLKHKTKRGQFCVCVKFEEEKRKLDMEDPNCEGCGKWKVTTKRSWDGKILCKRCFKNKPLTKFTKKTQKV